MNQNRAGRFSPRARLLDLLLQFCRLLLGHEKLSSERRAFGVEAASFRGAAKQRGVIQYRCLFPPGSWDMAGLLPRMRGSCVAVWFARPRSVAPHASVHGRSNADRGGISRRRSKCPCRGRRLRLQRAVKRGGIATGMNADVGEIGAKAGLHIGSDRFRQRRSMAAALVNPPFHAGVCHDAFCPSHVRRIRIICARAPLLPASLVAEPAG